MAQEGFVGEYFFSHPVCTPSRCATLTNRFHFHTNCQAASSFCLFVLPFFFFFFFFFPVSSPPPFLSLVVHSFLPFPSPLLLVSFVNPEALL